jgi:prevent-host-death family protein
MQKQASSLQEAAMKGPVLITYHDRPRLVLMSIEEYDRLHGSKAAVPAVAGSSARTAHQIAARASLSERDFLIAYSRGEISRNESMLGIGIDPSDTAIFAARMNTERIPWPKVDRQQAEMEAEELLEAVSGGQ